MYKEFEKLGVKVFSVSVDSKFVHKIWEEEELSKMVDGNIPFPMLSDGGGHVGRIYGVYSEESGVDIRGRFLIDPDGIIQSMEVMTPPVGRNVSEAIRQIQAYQHVRETKGAEVCPAGWEPGKPVLKPGPDLVGKVWTVWKPK
jgi:alkyl hydroperoxide reductase subunit AhpC